MNYRKLESARLLKMLDSTSIGELEQKEIKAILEDRQRRQAKAIAAIEATDIRHCSYRDWETDRKSTRLNSSHITRSRMPSSA